MKEEFDPGDVGSFEIIRQQISKEFRIFKYINNTASSGVADEGVVFVFDISKVLESQTLQILLEFIKGKLQQYKKKSELQTEFVISLRQLKNKPQKTCQLILVIDVVRDGHTVQLFSISNHHIKYV